MAASYSADVGFVDTIWVDKSRVEACLWNTIGAAAAARWVDVSGFDTVGAEVGGVDAGAMASCACDGHGKHSSIGLVNWIGNEVDDSWSYGTSTRVGLRLLHLSQYTTAPPL
jgi:hypothetical protein